MDRNTIQETNKTWQENPDNAILRIKVSGRSEGSKAVLESGPFTWMNDFPPPLGGNNEAPTPIAMLLGSLAACGIVMIKDTLAPLGDVQVDDVVATAECDIDGRGIFGIKGATSDISNLRLSFDVKSPNDPEKSTELINLWKQRCPVYLTFVKNVEIKMSH